MKTIFFHRENDYTGSTRVLANVIESEYAGSNVYVVASNPENKGFLSDLQGVRLISLWYPKLFGRKIKLFSYIFSQIHMFLVAVLFGFRFEYFYINTITPFPAAIAGKLLRRKIIFHVHEKFTEKNWNVSIIEWAFRNVEATRFYVSNYVREQYGNLAGDSMVKYNKLSPSFIRQVKVLPVNSRARRNIIMMCSLAAEKGIFRYIELARILPQYHFRLLVSANEERARSFLGQVPGNLELVAGTSAVHEFLRASDILLNLTDPAFRIETFGMTIIEAMAYGIPAIVPNVGGPLEVVIDGFNGYCVDVNDVGLLKRIIIESLDDLNYRRLASNSLERSTLFM